MSSFFLYSEEGAFLGLARQLEETGHEVRLFIKDEHAQAIGDGIVTKTTDPNPPEGSVVLFDMGGFDRLGSELRKRGFAVIGGNPAENELEKDRTAGHELMVRYGIKVPYTEEFSSFEEAREWLTENDGHFFIKVSGTAGDGSTTDAESPDMIRYLTWLEESGFKAKSFELQERIEGTEFDVEGWFDGERWVPGFIIGTIEEKRFMAGGVGPQTGSESSLLWLGADKFFDATLRPLEEYLREERYVGPVALNTIVTESGVPYGLEFTARLGWHESHANFRWLGDAAGDQLARFAMGKLERFVVETPAPVMLLNISVPPYPHFWYQNSAKRQGYPLDVAILTDPRITPEDVMLNDDGLPGMGGRNGNLGTIASTADGIEAQRAELLEVAHDLHIPQLQYRNDPVPRAEKTQAALAKLGFFEKGV